MRGYALGMRQFRVNRYGITINKVNERTIELRGDFAMKGSASFFFPLRTKRSTFIVNLRAMRGKKLTAEDGERKGESFMHIARCVFT